MSNSDLCIMYPIGYIITVKEGTERELIEYCASDGRAPFRTWMDSLKDKRTRARIDARLLRVRLGNFGDAKAVGGGVHELRINFGPGYRIYFGLEGVRVVVLLIGGDKTTQTKDIENAKTYWADYTSE